MFPPKFSVGIAKLTLLASNSPIAQSDLIAFEYVFIVVVSLMLLLESNAHHHYAQCARKLYAVEFL